MAQEKESGSYAQSRDELRVKYDKYMTFLQLLLYYFDGILRDPQGDEVRGPSRRV
jgi:hypothetical protein